MTETRRILRACALVCATLATIGEGRALAQKPVEIEIVVIQAETKDGPRLDDKMMKAMRGYKSAKIVDELKRSTEEGSSISLEIMKQSGAPQLLKVTVKDVGNDKTVKLHIAIDAIKFSTDTEHVKGGRIVICKELASDKALCLAITPTAS